MELSAQINNKVVELSKLILTMTTKAGSGHPSSSLSIIHLITVIMYKVMRYDPQNPWNPVNDRLILSEGHAVPAVYAAYADLGGAYGTSYDTKRILTKEDLPTLRQLHSSLDGHPNPSVGFPFFDFATGSLGQGLSNACGLALGARLNNINKHFFVIIGDGESREGQIWEACDFIMDYNLNEIIPIFNCNGLGQTGIVSVQQSAEKISAKLQAFGFSTFTIDGHDPDSILKSLNNAKNLHSPSAIIARTIKGWGVPEIQGETFHGKPLKHKLLNAAHQHLDSLLTLESSGTENTEELHPIVLPPSSIPDKKHDKIGNPDFALLLENDHYLETFKKGKMSTRRAFGLALREIAKIDERIVTLDGDVSNSTFTDYFSELFPDRFFQSRIAEQNMISVSAGLAASGYIPFATSFAKFLVRGYDQLEMALIANANIKLCGSHSGANIAADGPSQMGLTDLSYMRALSTIKTDADKPGMVIFNPSCAVAAYKMVQLMVDHEGLCYLRTIRQDLPILYHSDETFEIGGIKKLCEGKDIAIIASGYMVHSGKKVREELSQAGISASLYDCYSFPVNPEIVLNIAEENNGNIVTIEDNYGNGLGAEIASITASEPAINAAVKQLYIKRIPKSGLTAEDVFDYTGLGI